VTELVLPGVVSLGSHKLRLLLPARIASVFSAVVSTVSPPVRVVVMLPLEYAGRAPEGVLTSAIVKTSAVASGMSASAVVIVRVRDELTNAPVPVRPVGPVVKAIVGVVPIDHLFAVGTSGSASTILPPIASLPTSVHETVTV